VTAHRVVIVGGGFGGLEAAAALSRAPVEVTLVDRRNFHLFQPLLYQVATGGLSPGDIASPIRMAVKRQANARVVLGEVTGFDAAASAVLLADGGKIGFDSLIVAAGAVNHYFGRGYWEEYAPGLKTIEDSLEIRRRVLLAFENAERESDPARRMAWLTFVVVGAGATGVELAGALGELAHGTLRREFRNFNPADTRIILLDGGERILPAFTPGLSARAARSLARLGVTVRTSAMVESMDEEALIVKGAAGNERIEARTILWAAGIHGSPLGESLHAAYGAGLDRMGRVIVGPDFSLPGHPGVFVLGDLARFDFNGQPLPGIAPAAIQAGRYVSRLISRRLAGKQTPAFRYFDKGMLATIGRSAAVGYFRGVQFWGFPAWIVWLVIHIVYLIEFENRILVMIQWANNYFFRHRGSRLITDMKKALMVDR
jgi:NADH dehydrogenase